MPLLGPILTAAGAYLSRLLFSRFGAWIASAAVFLGIELVTASVVTDELRDMVISNFQGIPADIAAWMGVLRIDTYLTIILSAYAGSQIKKALVRRRTAP